LRHTNQGAQITGDTMSQERKTKGAQETKNTPEQKTPGKQNNIRGTNINSSIKHQSTQNRSAAQDSRSNK
jgi:hypothetical protein